MKTLRTPDERFANLQGYPFAPNYLHSEEAREEFAQVVVDFCAANPV